MLWKWFVCLSFLIVVTSEEVELSTGIEDAANEILLKFSQTHRHKLRELSTVFKENRKVQEAIINDYVDDLLNELNVFITMRGLDPVQIPDIKEGFEWRVILITYKGLMHLTDGWLQGLGTMDRFGDVKVTYQYPTVTFKLPMRYNVLMFDYKYKAKFMGLGPSGYVDGRTVNCRFTVYMEINMVTLIAKLNKFQLHTIGTVSLKFSGNILTDWITNVFVTVTIPLVKPILNIIVEGIITDVVLAIINFYNGLMCNLLQHC